MLLRTYLAFFPPKSRLTLESTVSPHIPAEPTIPTLLTCLNRLVSQAVLLQNFRQVFRYFANQLIAVNFHQ